MRSRVVWTVVVLLLIAAMLAPLAEGFDRWDTAPGLGGDTEFQLAAVALLAGLCAVVALVLVRVQFRLARGHVVGMVRVVVGGGGGVRVTVAQASPPGFVPWFALRI